MTRFMGSRCPVCGAAAAAEAAFVADVPVLLNVLVDDRERARAAPRARIALIACTHCGFIWNASFDGVPYDDSYLLDPTRSARYRSHLDAISDRVVSLAQTTQDRASPLDVVEIGSGQGHFVAHLAHRHPSLLGKVLGFDPAYRHGEVELPPNAEILPVEVSGSIGTYFEPHVVVLRHVIEHVADPVSFLASIRESLGKVARFAILLETPNVDRTLDAELLHDFCFEHCSMFGPDAIRACLERAGFGSIDVDPNAFDGEYLIATAIHDPDVRVEPTAAFGGGFRRTHAPDFERLEALGRRFVRNHSARIESRRAVGPLVLWGGAGKGALFAWLVDPDGVSITGVVDLLEGKHGHFLPGAGHRVISPEEALALGARTVIVSNPTYVDEVRDRCTAMGLVAEVLTIAPTFD